MGNLRTGLYNAAGSQAAGQQAQQLASLQSMGPEHTFNYGSQAFGGSLADIGKFLTDYYMRSKFPNTFANAGAS
jgi:hypothetical protein